jgi:hypothetical protein
MKGYRFWAKSAAVLMILTGLVHSLSLFVKSEPANETERQMLDLVTNYRMDAGAGFHPSFGNLFTALSSCFSLLGLLGGATLFHLFRKATSSATMSGLLTINLVIFGICFGMMAYFTFLPPVVLTGLIFVCLVAARILVKSE